MTGMPTAPDSFVVVCRALYGDMIDPDVVWEDVAKRNPERAQYRQDKAQFKTNRKDYKRANTRRNVERASNAVGITAGTLGTVAAVKDPRFAEGGRWQRKLHAATKDIPSPLGRHGGKVGAALATGALGTQVLNLGGDFLIGGTLAEKPAKPVRPVKPRKRAKAVVPTGVVDKGFKIPNLSAVVAGSRKAMRGVVDAAKTKAVDAVRTTGPAPGTPAYDQAIKTRQADRAARNLGHTTSQADQLKRDKGVERWGKVGYAAGKGSPAKQVGGAAAVVGTGAVLNQRRKASATPSYDSWTYAPTSKSYDFEATGEISKIDMDKHLVFGWISVSKINGAVVVDRQNDYIDPGDLEEAAYAYVHGSRVGGDMHGRGVDDTPRKVSDLVESVVFTPEKIEKMGLPSDFPIGWWGGFKVHDEQAWDDVKKGKRTGFSVHGKGRRTDVDLDELMGA